MIWFFIAGWIAGAVFMVLYAHHWVHKHTNVVKLPPLEERGDDDDAGNSERV